MPASSKLAKVTPVPPPKLFTGEFKRSTAGAVTTPRMDKAIWELIQARYQKGDQVNELTGSIYARMKPRKCTPRRVRASHLTQTLPDLTPPSPPPQGGATTLR